jgi:hypothetical protein
MGVYSVRLGTRLQVIRLTPFGFRLKRSDKAMTSSIRRCVIAVMIGAALSAAGSTGGELVGAVATKPAQTILGVAGLANATPSLAVLGRTVVAVWSAGKDGIVNVYAATSDDGGATFSEPRRVNDQAGDVSANSEQPPRVVISGSGASRTLTVIWSKRSDAAEKTRQDVIRTARSTDGGRTFSPARMIHDPKFSGARGWESLTAGPDGVVHAVWLDGRDAEKKMSGAPKGQPWQDVYHAVLAPDGRIVESQIATGVCFCCKTAVAVDGRGRVYAAWRHIFPGSIRDIAFASSTDGGLHFGPLVRVSEDKWELNGCPEDGPAMAVEVSGVIHIVWPTVVSEGEPQKALFYATSRDGKTFSPRARVPTAGATNPSHPQLTLTPDGGSVIVWDEVIDGAPRVSMSRVSRDGALGPPQVLSGSEPASHPVTVRPAAGDLLVAWTSRSSSDRSMISLRRISVPR